MYIYVRKFLSPKSISLADPNPYLSECLKSHTHTHLHGKVACRALFRDVSDHRRLYIHTHKERDMADYCCHLVMPIECLRNNRDEYILFLFSLIIYMIIR